jgi:uncharacterized protein (DUF1697 family)
MNLKMPELEAALQAARFADVRTVLSSGNAVFNAPPASDATIQKKAEAAIGRTLGRSFLTIVRRIDALREMLESDPYRDFRLPPGAKRVVTFLRQTPAASLTLPLELEGARILTVRGLEIFTAYVPHPKGATFMTLIEKTFGKEQTTRTWETVAKVVARATVRT